MKLTKQQDALIEQQFRDTTAETRQMIFDFGESMFKKGLKMGFESAGDTAMALFEAVLREES